MKALAGRLLAAVERCRCGGYPLRPPVRCSWTDPKTSQRVHGFDDQAMPCKACAEDLALLGVDVGGRLFA